MTSASKWWQDYHGPKLLLSKIIEAIDLKNSFIIKNNNLFWFSKFIDALIEKVKSEIDLELNIIDLSQERYKDLQTIPDILVEFFPDTTHPYLSALQMSKLTYLKKNNLLKNRIVLFINGNRQQDKEFFAFLKEYKNFDQEVGFFGIITNEIETYQGIKNSQLINAEKLITDFNVQLFINSIVSNKFSNTIIPYYLSNLYFYLSLKNPETADILMNKYNLNNTDPLTISFDNLSKDWRDRLVWEAQVTSFFPMIDVLRIKIIEKYAEDLEFAIENHTFTKTNIEKKIFNFEGQKFKDIYELDIGNLQHIGKFLKMDNKQRKLINFFSSEDDDLIEIIREFRNPLAHHKPLNLKKVKQVITKLALSKYSIT